MRVMDCFNLRWVSAFLGTNRLMGWNMKLGMIYEVRFTIKPLKNYKRVEYVGLYIPEKKDNK
jgi:hypothetical protein